MPQKPGIDLNDTSNRIIAAIIIAFVFIGGWWLIARNASSGSAPASEITVQDEFASGTSESPQVTPTSVFGPLSEETPTIAGSRESVDVEDQRAGMSVTVKSATFAQVSWLAVRDVDGRTLGAGRFEPGTHTDFEVPLLRATTAGGRYQVLIYVDDGDKAFNLHQDILVMRADGSVAGDVFSAQ